MLLDARLFLGSICIIHRAEWKRCQWRVRDSRRHILYLIAVVMSRKMVQFAAVAINLRQIIRAPSHPPPQSPRRGRVQAERFYKVISASSEGPRAVRPFATLFHVHIIYCSARTVIHSSADKLLESDVRICCEPEREARLSATRDPRYRYEEDDLSSAA